MIGVENFQIKKKYIDIFSKCIFSSFTIFIWQIVLVLVYIAENYFSECQSRLFITSPWVESNFEY